MAPWAANASAARVAVVPAPTAVELMSFEATAADGAVDLTWQTASELDNLGFHLYRSLSETGPWTRITSSLIPGLGSSPIGGRYSYTDTGLTNGTAYTFTVKAWDADAGKWESTPPTAESVESWRHLLYGLWWSGLRLGEALNLYWDRPDKLRVDLSGKRPMLRILAELEKLGRQATELAADYAWPRIADNNDRIEVMYISCR